MTFVVVLVQLVAATEYLLATLATLVKNGEIQSPLGAQTCVLVPLAAVTSKVGVPASLPPLEVEDLDVLPSPHPASKVIRPISPTNELKFFLKPSMFAPISACLDNGLRICSKKIIHRMS